MQNTFKEMTCLFYNSLWISQHKMDCWHSQTAGKMLMSLTDKTIRIVLLALGSRNQNVVILVLNDRKISLANRRKYSPREMFGKQNIL